MSFRWKLMGALVLTAVCAAVGTYLLTFRSIGEQFDMYRAQERRVAAHDAAVWLAQYWESQDSWAGIQRYFSTQISFRWGGEVVYQQSLMGQLMLLDRNHQVVACADESLLGRCPETDDRLEGRIKQAGVPVIVDDEQVGTVVPMETVDLTPVEQDYLASVRRGTLIGGSIALALAAVMGTLLATQLSAPLRQLIQATERIASGDLSHRVPWRRRDETGRLAVAMNHMAEELQSSENARQQLLTDVAHELRTPLTVIQGNLEAMMDGVFPLTADSLSSVYSETLQLGSLIEELRDLTLAEGGRLRMEKETLDLGNLVHSTCEGLRPAFSEHGTRLAVDVDEGIWVQADSRRLRQVIANLLSNALRFSKDGETVNVACQRRGQEAEVSVEDTGPGIAPEDLPYVFERFYKADPSRADEGSGLGLAIAREIIHAHNGRIWVDSKVGQGTRFTFVLPLVADHEPPA